MQMNTAVYNIIALIFVAGIVLGIKLMSSPKTAVRGNLLGAICMFGAIVLTLVSNGIISSGILWVSMAIGGLVGYFLAVKVAMIQMPQLVALLNGLGGGASAGVALVVLFSEFNILTLFSKFTSALALVVGAVTFSGSMIAAAKLDQKMTQKPIVLSGHSILSGITIALLIVFVFLTTILSDGNIQAVLILTLLIALFFGVLFTIRVGGADMPVTISLLNSLSGVAGSITGFAIYNPLLVAVGAIVGAAGLILTQIMCRGMNRSLFEVLTGKTSVSVSKNTARVNEMDDAKSESLQNTEMEEKDDQDEISAILRETKKVVIVPGYGMALAQAQFQVKTLCEKLESQGKSVKFAIHPVAGRMPGHMNVLLAEVDVDYDKLYEMDSINPEFKETDLVIIVGANDVVNPAAITAEGTPIYGMPILRVDEAKHIIVCNRSTKPGYAGVENPLFNQPNVHLLLGDAAETIKILFKKLNNSEGEVSKKEVSQPQKTKSEEKNYLKYIREAKKVIIIPGYGMALAQAQSQVKRLMEKLEGMGIDVKFAIHPVAGRMPGHMNVLLAEVDIDYDKLYELEDINPEFSQTDVVIIVGANDVVNPAAITAEGTPIYGMPILRADEAKHVIICNRSAKPGYAGVDNPLYKQKNVTLLLGDAAQTVSELVESL